MGRWVIMCWVALCWGADEGAAARGAELLCVGSPCVGVPMEGGGWFEVLGVASTLGTACCYPCVPVRLPARIAHEVCCEGYDGSSYKRRGEEQWFRDS